MSKGCAIPVATINNKTEREPAYKDVFHPGGAFLGIWIPASCRDDRTEEPILMQLLIRYAQKILFTLARIP
jgi:hypothetical protein